MSDQKDLIPAEDTSLELKVLTIQDGVIKTNADEIMVKVEKALVRYDPEKFSAENIPDAKKARADLNAAADALNAKRIELERIWLKPFDEFKGKVAAIQAKIKDVSRKIDETIKAAEEKDREEKKKQITEYFNGLGPQPVVLNKIWDPRWLNKGDTIASVQKAIDAKLFKIKEDLAVLDRVNEPGIKEHYLVTLDLTGALRRADELKAARERLEAASAAEVPTANPPEETITPTDAPVRVSFGGGGVSVGIRKPPERTYVLTLKNPTDEQVEMIKAFLDASGVQYLIA